MLLHGVQGREKRQKQFSYFNINILIFQYVKKSPFPTPPSEKKAIVQLLLESDKIEVQREVHDFPFESLVADVGGILGLFIGFNFLMIWDFIEDIRKRMNLSCNDFFCTNVK